MAPITINPPQLGLHQSEIPEPPPLRIIKRSKTVSGSSASGESLCGRRGGSSSSSLYSKGSPTFPADRSLTVHKLRKGRASILGSKTGKPGGADFRTSVFDTPKKSSVREDKDVTPKAQPAYRLSSAGVFLKDEYHGCKDINDQGYYSLRANRHSFNLFERPNDPPSSKNTSPIIPERRVTKSKNFLLRALGGNSQPHPPLRRTTSTTSRKTLVRRLSRRRDSSAGSFDSSYAGSELSSETACSFEPSSYEFYDASAHPSQPIPSSSSDSMMDTPPQDIAVLYPHIMVTPEVSTLDAGLSILWVAIVITGVLQAADGSASQRPRVEIYPTETTKPGSSDLSSYGKLHSMRIDLHPGQGCTVLEIIGNLHESKTIRAGETQLILAKIRVAKVKIPREGSEDSTEGMIADLQNQLGDTISAYLTIRLTYKHSAFPNHKPLDPSDGMKFRISRIETEATATIKRRNSESAWSPRTSQTLEHPLVAGPVLTLVENHYSVEKAEEVRRRLIHDRSPISIARNFGYWDAGGSPGFPAPYFQKEHIGVGIDSAVDSLRTAKSRKSLRRSVVTRPQLQEAETEIFLGDGLMGGGGEDMDPARKIWSEMRLTSTGGRQRRNRASLSVNHYFSMEDEKAKGLNLTSTLAQARGRGEENHPPLTSAFVKGNDKSHPNPTGDVTHERERERIIEVALRNKRSVGAETLRSIAPSTHLGAGDGGGEKRGRVDGRGKNWSATGLGLGVGRAWGWTAPWW